MAILSKIRDRSMILILIVGMALFAFVLDPSSIQNFFSTSKINSIGQVNGEDIDREAFAKEVEAYRAQSSGSVTQMQAINVVWNNFVSEIIYKTQLEEAGIVVGEKDIWDAMIALPEIQNAPLFKNEANLFDEEKLKEYIANMKDEAESGNPQTWLNWLATEKSIQQNLERQAYTSLVNAGLSASLKDGERAYLYENTRMDAKFVYVPYSSIPDSLSNVSKEEIRDYIEDHENRFKPEATRSLQFVKFDILPSEEDDTDIKNEVAGLIDDKEEYSNAVKATVNVAGLKNTTDYSEFLTSNKSDLSIDNGYRYQNQLNASISEEIMGSALNDVVGPYKDNGYYKISKVVEILQLPDSVKSSHILVAYAGSTRSTSMRTKQAAKKTADSIYTLVKNSASKFVEVADEVNTDGTKGKGGDIGWIAKNQAFSNAFDPDFANFIFKNKTDKVAVVETAFGYHIIKIDEQTSYKNAVRLTTFGRLIEASEKTENIIFEEAETLTAKLSEGTGLEALAGEKNYQINSAVNLKVLDEQIPGLTNQRQIVTWAYEPQRELGDSKRFDIEIYGKRGYAVVVLNHKTDEDGIVVSSSIISQVRPELVNKKKAESIIEKLSGTTLEEIASSSNTNVRTATSVTLASPLISGVGNEPKVVGAMSTLKLEEISDVIEGEKGVFVLMVTKRDAPVALENYDTFRNTEVLKIKGRTYQLYPVLEQAADIKDNRGKFF